MFPAIRPAMNVIAPVIARIVTDTTAATMKEPTTSTERDSGSVRIVSRSPRSSAPTIGPATARIAK